MPSRWLRALVTLGALLHATSGSATPIPEDLSSLSLEQLANITITSVSGYAEQLSDAPASVFVITNDDIRRSGARSLPEALRLAPNLQVAQVSANSYSISARGMNNSASNKLLVLVDGRILYTPLYSGMLWYAQDQLLEDVERIEVISGPGGTLWGSNAVNGVINVITRSAADTRGGLVAVGAGSRDRAASARFGRSAGNGAIRVYAKALDERAARNMGGADLADARERVMAGFRGDWASGLTVQGETYRGTVRQLRKDPVKSSGSNIQSSFTTKLRDAGTLRLLAYVDESDLEVPGAFGPRRFEERLNIFHAEMQHDLPERGPHAVNWGLAYRTAHDHLVNDRVIAFLPDNETLHWADAFVQDRIALAQTVDFTTGVKFEHNSYTGLETMPTARLAWKPSPDQLLWGEVSRAVRTPSRLDRDLYSPSEPPFIIAGGPGFRSETADVLEIGYRANPSPTVTYSITAFANRFRHLRSIELREGHFYEVANQMRATSKGVEAWASVQLARAWRVSAGAAYLDEQVSLAPDSTDVTGVGAAGNDPSLQWTLRSSFDLPGNTEVDLAVRHVGELPQPRVAAYTAVDLRIGWQVAPGVELSVVGQNLFDPEHIEFGAPATAAVIPRSVFFKLLWTL